MEEQNCIKQLLRESRNEGLFTPPSLQGTIQMPGNNGGANWGSSAVDPAKGTMYVLSKETPMGILLTAPGGTNNKSWRNCAPATARGGGGGGGGGGGRGAAPGGGAPGGDALVPGGCTSIACRRCTGTSRWSRTRRRSTWWRWRRSGWWWRSRWSGRWWWAWRRGNPVPPNTGDLTRYTQNYQFFYGTSNGTSIIGPPWTQLTAYDLNTGKIIWRIPVGSIPGLEDKNTGAQFTRGGVLVTGGGLVMVASPSDRKLHAYDQDNGKLIWEFDLPSVSEGVPTVYQVAGKQYIAFCVGGGQLDQPRSFSTLPPQRRVRTWCSRFRRRRNKEISDLINVQFSMVNFQSGDM
jgi:quinoprotein glucose dehydrogenase